MTGLVGLSSGGRRHANRQHPRSHDAAGLWEIAIKRGLGRADFQVDPRLLRRGPLDNGYQELAVASAHAVAVDDLQPIHEDPFDRILVAQSQVEGIVLPTADPLVARYAGPVRMV